MARAEQYGARKQEDLLANLTSPIPRFRMVEGDSLSLSDQQLADEVVRLFTIRRAQLAEQNIMDMRLMRWYDPEQLEDQWKNVWTGEPLRKLSHSKGLSVENYNWCKPVVEALVGLLAGFKPMAYDIDVEPEDETSEADGVQSEIIEKFLRMEQDRQNYPITYQDGMGYLTALGRWWRYVIWDPDMRQVKTQTLWPGNVAAFWQGDQRTIEQVVVARHLSVGEAVDLYPEKRQAIIDSITGPSSSGGAGESVLTNSQSKVTLLTFWYRTGRAKTETIGMATVLIGAAAKDGTNNLLLERGADTGYDDIPLRCTPRFKTMDKNPDEAQGILMDVAPLNTEFNEVMSAFRDMIWRAIYQRYVAKGFTFKNAPRLNQTVAGVIPLPRVDQDLRRLDEVLNTVPVEQVLARLEEMIIVFPGLNRYFLGSAPPSETSGEAITAAINASITRLEPIRTNIQADETWMYAQWLAFYEKYGEYGGERMDELIEGKRKVRIYWADISHKDAQKARTMALSGVQQGLISRDSGQSTWGVQSKTDENRKILREFKDPWLHPERVSQTASAIMQWSQAMAALQQTQGGGMGAPPGGQGDQMQRRAAESGRTAAAMGAAPQFESDNAAGILGNTQGTGAPPPAGG